MESLRQTHPNRKLSVTEFTYDPATRKFFRYGQEWKAAGVNANVDRIEHQGRLIRATVWLKLQAVAR